MGIEKSKLSARFALQNAEFIAELCERWSPIVEGVSATLNLIVAVIRRMERAGTIDLSLVGLQRQLRRHCGQSGQQDSVAPEPRRADKLRSNLPTNRSRIPVQQRSNSAEMPTGAIPDSVAAHLHGGRRHGDAESPRMAHAANVATDVDSALPSLDSAEAGAGRPADDRVRIKRPPRRIHRPLQKIYRLDFPDGRHILVRHFLAREVEVPLSERKTVNAR